MRVRPFFWFLLAASCISILLFASYVHIDLPVKMQVVLDQSHLQAAESTTLTLHLSDMQGVPIDDAQAVSHVNMTNMDMGDVSTHFQPQGQGKYVTHVQWTMSGPWSVTINVHANGFASSHQTILIDVI
jgi:nitrogen fixation protein FixH